MKALIGASLFALAIATGVTASQAAPEDGCHSLSVHGMWDCR
jgi:hypothetical protein